MPEANEAWQVEVNGTIYDAPFSELPDWIDGGSLLPEDKVRKGNLRWIEARRVPALVPFFNAKGKGEPMPVVVSVSEPEPIESEPAVEIVADVASKASATPAATSNFVPADPSRCTVHSDVESFYVCDGCSNSLCKACPSSYGGSVKICPLCGALCKPQAEVSQKRKTDAIAASSDGGGDIPRAFAHPFKFKTSLLFGAGLFALFTVGQAAAGIGGIFLMVSALFCGMLANMLKFGVLSNTVDNFVQGKLDANFMPDFENFEIWDDIIHPFFLSIAAYVVSFGPFFVTLIIGFYMVMSTVAETNKAIQADLEKIPGTHIYSGRELAEQSGQVKDVVARIGEENARRAEIASNRASVAATQAESGEPPTEEPYQVIDEESRQQEELWAAATESRKKSLESAMGKTPETQAREQAEIFKAFLGLAAPLVVVGFITFLWGAFLFPAACAVAGYSKSFLTTINPLVCLDTIKRLGGSYVKILAIGLLLIVLWLVFATVVSMVFAPFDLPALGNIPATGVAALFTFYLWTVFSCMIGYTLLKKADKLGLLR